jgi:hypothetical protein
MFQHGPTSLSFSVKHNYLSPLMLNVIQLFLKGYGIDAKPPTRDCRMGRTSGLK